MYTIAIAIFVVFIAGAALSMISEEGVFTLLGGLAAVVGLICLLFNANMSEINGQASKGVEVATPAKYTNQTYYIDNSKRLYIQQNDTTKPFGEDVSSKIEYKDSAKEPAIEFKTIKSVGDPDDWVPFKHKEIVKTSISKIILPKSALTGNLTKVTVLNSSQPDSSDLSLAD